MRRAGLVAALVLLCLASIPSGAHAGEPVAAVVVYEIHGATPAELLQVPQIRALASSGGAALLIDPDQAVQGVHELGGHGVRLHEINLGTVPPGLSSTERRAWLSQAGRLIDSLSSPSPDVQAIGPPAQQVVIGWSPRGGLGSLVYDGGLDTGMNSDAPVALSSESTHRVGLADANDVRGTIARYAGLDVEGRVPLATTTKPVPVELYDRYVEHQQIAFPIQVAAGIAVAIIGFVCIGLVALRRKVPRLARTIGPWLTLTPAVLASALLAAGSLPHLTYATVVPFVVLVTAVGAAIPLLWRHRGVLSPPVVLGIGVILFFLIEAALGWPSTLTTIFGGTALDGVRFYGLPNVFEGLLYGSGLYIAASRKSLQGVALLFALGMFAGFPGLGADLGGALSCFAAAGLWLALAERGSRNTKMVWRLAQGALVALAGLIVVLVANRFAPTATHITAFTESGGGGILHTIASRLGVGWDLLMRNPFGFIPVLGILILLVVVLKPPAAIRESFAAFPAWRTAMLVLVLTSVVAYFANDTGVAASGQGFAMALAGLLYVPLALIPRKMDT